MSKVHCALKGIEKALHLCKTSTYLDSNGCATLARLLLPALATLQENVMVLEVVNGNDLPGRIGNCSRARHRSAIGTR